MVPTKTNIGTQRVGRRGAEQTVREGSLKKKRRGEGRGEKVTLENPRISGMSDDLHFSFGTRKLGENGGGGGRGGRGGGRRGEARVKRSQIWC